jgi:maleylpyruvate isomerase
MRLYGYWRSTATWRVRIALAHKGVAYEYVPVHLRRDGGEQNRPEFAAVNPMQRVPVLEWTEHDHTVRLVESLAIIEYLEERHPHDPLLPSDSFLRARARQLALVVTSGIQPLQNTGVQQYLETELHQDAKPWIRHWVGKGLTALETMTRETAGRFSIGDLPTIADVCLVPQLYFARRFGVDLAAYPTLVRIDAACSEIEAFQKAHAERQVDAEL